MVVNKKVIKTFDIDIISPYGRITKSCSEVNSRNQFQNNRLQIHSISGNHRQMKRVLSSDLTARLSEKMADAAFILSDDISELLNRARVNEKNNLSFFFLSQILDNAKIARNNRIPLCQDTGTVVIWATIGQEVNIQGSLSDALTRAVSTAYTANPLRKSIVSNPLKRENTGDNTPPVIHTDIVDGDIFEIRFLLKGGGSENVSRACMLNPSDGQKGVVDFIQNAVREAGASPCPPILLGIGIGGTFDTVGWLAKKSLFRDFRKASSDVLESELEERILSEVNALNIGPAGMGGPQTCLGVNVITAPCHIASLPVAVCVQCHSHRKGILTC